MNHKDPVLSVLCANLVDRHLFRAEMQNEPFDTAYLEAIRKETMVRLNLEPGETGYFVIEDTVTNNAYSPKSDRIRILLKNNRLLDLSEASEQLNISVLSGPVSKHVLFYPKIINARDMAG